MKGNQLFFTYSGITNNCQNFIMNLLKASNISNSLIELFIKQDVSYVNKHFPSVRNIMNFTTGIAGKFNTLID
jgi:hypothetical protein